MNSESLTLDSFCNLSYDNFQKPDLLHLEYDNNILSICIYTFMNNNNNGTW